MVENWIKSAAAARQSKCDANQVKLSAQLEHRRKFIAHFPIFWSDIASRLVAAVTEYNSELKSKDLRITHTLLGYDFSAHAKNYPSGVMKVTANPETERLNINYMAGNGLPAKSDNYVIALTDNSLALTDDHVAITDPAMRLLIPFFERLP